MDLNLKKYYLPDFTPYADTIVIAIFWLLTIIFILQKKQELKLRDYLMEEFLNKVRILNLDIYSKIVSSLYSAKTGGKDVIRKLTYKKFKEECKKYDLHKTFKLEYKKIVSFRWKIALEYLVLTALYFSLIYLLPDILPLAKELAPLLEKTVLYLMTVL